MESAQARPNAIIAGDLGKVCQKAAAIRVKAKSLIMFFGIDLGFPKSNESDSKCWLEEVSMDGPTLI